MLGESKSDLGLETIPCLLCDSCESPVCCLSDIITERSSVLDKAVYSYELDILGEDVWVYSATNPSARRFDVVRCSSSVVAQRTVTCDSEFSPEHTWFPPNEWCMCSCTTCGRHLGWGFSIPQQRDGPAVGANAEDRIISASSPTTSDVGVDVSSSGNHEDAECERRLPSQAVVFVGIIVTHCKAVEQYPLDRYHEQLDSIDARIAQQKLYQKRLRQLFRILPRIEDQLAANRLAMQLLNVPVVRRVEVVSQLLREASALPRTSAQSVVQQPDESSNIERDASGSLLNHLAEEEEQEEEDSSSWEDDSGAEEESS